MRKILFYCFLFLILISTNVSQATYDYTTGRWLQRDPIGYADGTNLYEYGKNKPTGTVDALGLWNIPIDKLVCGKDFDKLFKVKKEIDFFIAKISVDCKVRISYNWLRKSEQDCKIEERQRTFNLYHNWSLRPPYVWAMITIHQHPTFKATGITELSGYYDAWHDWGVRAYASSYVRLYKREYVSKCCDCVGYRIIGSCTGEEKLSNPRAAATAVAIVALSPQVIAAAKEAIQAALEAAKLGWI